MGRSAMPAVAMIVIGLLLSTWTSYHAYADDSGCEEFCVSSSFTCDLYPPPAEYGACPPKDAQGACPGDECIACTGTIIQSNKVCIAINSYRGIPPCNRTGGQVACGNRQLRNCELIATTCGCAVSGGTSQGPCVYFICN